MTKERKGGGEGRRRGEGGHVVGEEVVVGG